MRITAETVEIARGLLESGHRIGWIMYEANISEQVAFAIFNCGDGLNDEEVARRANRIHPEMTKSEVARVMSQP